MSRGRAAAVLLGLAELALTGLAVVFFGLSAMLFDAPGAGEDPRVWLAHALTALLPLVLAGGALCAFVAAVRGWRPPLVVGAVWLPLAGLLIVSAAHVAVG